MGRDRLTFLQEVQSLSGDRLFCTGIFMTPVNEWYYHECVNIY